MVQIISSNSAGKKHRCLSTPPSTDIKFKPNCKLKSAKKTCRDGCMWMIVNLFAEKMWDLLRNFTNGTSDQKQIAAATTFGRIKKNCTSRLMQDKILGYFFQNNSPPSRPLRMLWGEVTPILYVHIAGDGHQPNSRVNIRIKKGFPIYRWMTITNIRCLDPGRSKHLILVKVIHP